MRRIHIAIYILCCRLLHLPFTFYCSPQHLMHILNSNFKVERIYVSWPWTWTWIWLDKQKKLWISICIINPLYVPTLYQLHRRYIYTENSSDEQFHILFYMTPFFSLQRAGSGAVSITFICQKNVHFRLMHKAEKSFTKCSSQPVLSNTWTMK